MFYNTLLYLQRLILISTCFAATLAQRFAQPGLVRPDESPKPYQFQYIAPAINGQSTRQESADGSGRVVGSYTVQNEDGSTRTVEYVADESGFRANIQTNEPGTRSESPADVVLLSNAPDPFLGQVDFGPARVRPRPGVRARRAASRFMPYFQA